MSTMASARHTSDCIALIVYVNNIFDSNYVGTVMVNIMDHYLCVVNTV